MVGMLAGLFGVAELEQAGTGEEALQTAAAGAGLTGLAVVAVVQLVLTVLVVWWLTRPTQPGANLYGPEPAPN
jgi:uncharacterized membrane protein YhaH (DUF805 family)